MRRLLPTAVLLLAACATTPKTPITAPQWDAIPPGVVETLCRRLQADALATGTTNIVSVTQPLVTPQSLSTLTTMPTGPGKGRSRKMIADATTPYNRAIPISLGRGSCTWQPVDVRDIPKHSDAMLVELSAPILNPVVAREAGLFARVSLGGTNASWYWIQLLPQGGGWAAGRVSVMP